VANFAVEACIHVLGFENFRFSLCIRFSEADGPPGVWPQHTPIVVIPSNVLYADRNPFFENARGTDAAGFPVAAYSERRPHKLE